jgi:hypothetical protein
VASDGSYYAPDAIVLNETSDTQLAALRDELNREFSATTPTPTTSSTPSPSPSPSVAAGVTETEARSSFLYEIVGDADVPKAKLLVNVGTIDVSNSSARSWADDCKSDRQYQLASGLEERGSGTSFTLAGVHLPNDYGAFLLPADCRARNADRLRAELAGEREPIIIGGDFNRRSTSVEGECDPNEANRPVNWWSRMTSVSDRDGRRYVDAARSYNRSVGLDLRDEWTHERRLQTALCTGATGYRRSRIDFMFVSADVVIHEAHADHPGWAGRVPGTTNCEPTDPYCKYSDHRVVWARLGIGP